MLATGLCVAENTENFSTFDGLDKNSDGYISITEAQGDPDLLKHWVVLDTDADGKIEIVEFSAFESEDAPASFYVPPDDEGAPGAAPY
jgi:hypothetical protein